MAHKKLIAKKNNNNNNKLVFLLQPSVERCLQMLEDESDLEAVFVLVQLIMDNLKDPCTNNVAGSFCLPGHIGDTFSFVRFVEAQIHEKVRIIL